MLELPLAADATYDCTECSHRADWQFQLDHHVQRSHRNVIAAELFHAKVTPEVYRCVSCGFKSYHKFDQYEHCLSQHDARLIIVIDAEVEIKTGPCYEEFEKFFCGFCTYKGNSILSLVEHHGSCKMMCEDAIEYVALPPTSTMEPRVAAEKMFQCVQCPYETKRGYHFKRHLVTHAAAEEVNWFYCTECSYQAKHARYLKRHMLTHASGDDVKWFNCTKCSYRSKENGNLTKHVTLTHAAADDIDWFNCDKCPYRAKQRGTLRRHNMLKHAADDEIDWFICSNCSFRCKQKSDLKKHLLKHAATSDIDWFNCSQCSYRAKQKSDLNKHLVTHVANRDIRKWHTCERCAYRSKRKDTLKRHMWTHTIADDMIELVPPSSPNFVHIKMEN